jgi:hypothetical protein
MVSSTTVRAWAPQLTLQTLSFTRTRPGSVCELCLSPTYVELTVTRCSFHPSTGAVQISERAILDHVRVLSEDIGFRTVGTREHAAADAWMHKKALELKELCEQEVKKQPGRRLECEVWRQVGSGHHR